MTKTKKYWWKVHFDHGVGAARCLTLIGSFACENCKTTSSQAHTYFGLAPDQKVFLSFYTSNGRAIEAVI